MPGIHPSPISEIVSRSLAYSQQTRPYAIQNPDNAHVHEGRKAADVLGEKNRSDEQWNTKVGRPHIEHNPCDEFRARPVDDI